MHIYIYQKKKSLPPCVTDLNKRAYQPHNVSIRPYHHGMETQTDQTSHNEDYAINDDPIFSNHVKLYIVPYLKPNMLMLDNQLCKLVLEKLVSFQNDNSLKVETHPLSIPLLATLRLDFPFLTLA
ncbi:hypothetical protein Pfo_024516 [Paulownia fortunei]|nr:hypothetical protein Pfo_024516 [Paulownia fortunei]